jgi:GH15 family glucan-1,4-alpha-glucosidase
LVAQPPKEHAFMQSIERARLQDLAHQSVGIIRGNQAPSGAYIASPSFPVYRFSWLRDGAFIADAMSRAGQIDSAEAFFGWCAEVLRARRAKIEDLIGRRAAREPIAAADFLHTRYTLDGEEAGDEWWNFQLDGYGAWLWALGEHLRRHGRAIGALAEGAELSARYIAAFWDEPSFDWWEENADRTHTSTLGAIYAGLRAAADWAELSESVRGQATEIEATVRQAILADARRAGHLSKWLGGQAVDASLLACAVPFGLLRASDPLMAATVRRIEADLVHGGGVHRYLGDTYYGGGEWLLLAALLGWHYASVGRVDEARGQLAWVAARATPARQLPEQVDDHLLAPDARPAWLERWGPVAVPLLWSHAMYLTLALELGIVEAPVEASRGLPVRTP